MTELQVGSERQGGFVEDPLAALNPPVSASPCCGTAAEAEAEGSCCGSAAKQEAVASGAGCCG